MSSRLDAASYRARGWVPVPIPRGQKWPKLPGWQRLTGETSIASFAHEAERLKVDADELNVGILLGDASAGLVDVDLDCGEALELAADFLPTSTLTFGRASRPRSHFLFIAPSCPTEQYVYDTGQKDEKGRPIRDTLLELRANGGLQTVFPPSVHPSGEQVAFDLPDAAIMVLSNDELQLRTRQLAAAALLVRLGFERELAVRTALDLDWSVAEGMPEHFAKPLKAWLGAPEPPAPAAQPAGRTARQPIGVRMKEAVDRWVADHPRTYPRHTGECPVCGDKGSFGHLPDDPRQWHCFSTDHPEVGIKGAHGYHGDALDLEAWARGCKPIEVLVRDGYYSPTKKRATEPPAASGRVSEGGATLADKQTLAEPAIGGGEVVPIDRGRRVYRNNSYLTAVQIVEANDRNVLGQGARLEFDEMAGRVMLNRQPVKDVDELRVRAEIERVHVGGIDDQGRTRGLKLSREDVRNAMIQVAYGRSYHPVREYLSGLTWDQTPRLDQVAKVILGAPDTLLNRALVRRYMVSAVARAFAPGCKVDTALILVGKTGLGKSSFFRILSSPWFIDTVMDVNSPKALMTLRRAWIYEWAELEVMRRVEDINAAKAWVSSPTDEYVPQYGHNAVEVPRGFVVAGTTEEPEFLVDEKGNRRWWPLPISYVDRGVLRLRRDQLWAEALSIYQAWVKDGSKEEETPWVLSKEEDLELDKVHGEHQTTDSWADAVIDFAERRVLMRCDFTTADVLEDAIKKPTGQRTRSDDMRVAAILKRAGFKLGPKPAGRSRTWVRIEK